jgi:hypothetical protein
MHALLSLILGFSSLKNLLWWYSNISLYLTDSKYWNVLGLPSAGEYFGGVSKNMLGYYLPVNYYSFCGVDGTVGTGGYQNY